MTGTAPHAALLQTAFLVLVLPAVKQTAANLPVIAYQGSR
jgi:hypothetical protein